MKPKLSYFSAKLSKKLTRQTIIVLVILMVVMDVVAMTEVGVLSVTNYSRAVENTKLKIETVLKKIESVSLAMSRCIYINPGVQSDLAGMTASILQVDTNIFSCAIALEDNIVDNDGLYSLVYSYKDGDSVVTECIREEDSQYKLRDWYQIPMLKGESCWIEPSYDFNENTIATSYSVPILDENDRFRGVLKLSMSLSGLQKIVGNTHAFAQKKDVSILVSQAGTYIAHEEKFMDSVMNETIYAGALHTGSERDLDECIRVMNSPSGMTVYPVDGIYRHMQYYTLYNGWHLLGITGYPYLFIPVRNILLILTIICILGVLWQYFSMKKIIKRMTTPISLLTYAAMNMSRGNFEATVPELSQKDEIQKLAVSMRLLQKTIIQYIGELKTTTAEQERMASEMNVASAIQMAFLPTDFSNTGDFDCHASLKPAKSVGGDLYDFNLYGNTFRFAMGDVSGKGVPAAMYMAVTKFSFNFLKDSKVGLGGVMARINNAFCETNKEGMFVTLFIAEIDKETLELNFCNGGHNPMIIVDADGTARYIKCKSNIALGLFPDFPYESEIIQLHKGDRIIAYTDGVTEAENSRKELFGEDRLLEFASNLSPEMSSREVIDGIIEKVHEFTGDNEQNDDLTIFTVKV